MRDLGSLARLIRMPAALTVPGDSLAGAAAAGWPLGPRTALLPVSSALIYWAGMALNDYADRELDAVERPERPIPSGAVSPREALAVAIALTAGGLAVAALAGGRRSLAVAVPLVCSVWSYDLLLKATPLGPVMMSAARGLDVLLGTGGRAMAPAVPAAITVATHTLATTLLSRDEVHGSRSGTVGTIALLGTASAAIAATTVAGAPSAVLSTARRAFSSVTALGLAAVYVQKVAPRQAAARSSRRAVDVRKAVGASVIGVIPLQAAIIARQGAVGVGVAVAALLPLAVRLTRRNSAT